MMYSNIMEKHRIYTTSFAGVYPHYVAKVERKGQSVTDLNTIICWLTGYSQNELNSILDSPVDFETFFTKAPAMNPSRRLITGIICGIRVEAIQQPIMQEIRYLDKLVDELAKGRAMEKIIRTQTI